MRCLLVQIDGKMANLALSKLSTFLKSKGHQAGFDVNDPEEVYISCIFQKNLPKAYKIETSYPNSIIHLGGPALWEPNYLPKGAEHLMPDYSLYPSMDYSMGYTSRGCPNNCPFCIVPKLEGSFYEYAPILEFQNPDFTNLLLFDNNFFYSKLWKEKLNYIEEQGLRVSLFQGVDAATITPEKAIILKEVGAWSPKFKSKRYYFSWDLMAKSDAIFKGLQTVIDMGIKPYNIMVYVLTGFNTTHAENYYRFRKLRELKVDPFVMVYNDRHDDSLMRHFSRWVNKRIYKSDPFSKYKMLNEGERLEVEELERCYNG